MADVRRSVLATNLVVAAALLAGPSVYAPAPALAAGLPTFTIPDPSVIEGNPAPSASPRLNPTCMQFTVSLTEPVAVGATATVRYYVPPAAGAVVTSETDYDAVSGALVFGPGVSMQQFCVSVASDNEVESDEQLTAIFYDEAGAHLPDREAVGTIINDDGTGPILSFDLMIPLTVNETDSLAARTITFTVRISASPADFPATASYTMGSATSDDYRFVATADAPTPQGTFVWDAGGTDLDRTITVEVVDDAIPECTEVVDVSLGAPTNSGFAAHGFNRGFVYIDLSDGRNLRDCQEEASPADFDGDGRTDRSVFRDGAWYADSQASAFVGVAGDIPVPADYDGDRRSDRAVYRDGAWYTEGRPTVYLGLVGDVPVPGDYNGDGRAERAVFRPSEGAWYTEGQATAYLGAPGDIPVPGDYNNDQRTVRAVFRPSAGGWYIAGQDTVFLGLGGDIPVPVDYDNNGTTDRAVFRPSVGGWYVDRQPTVYVGLDGDIPVPGDYDANGFPDRGVFRPSVGGWYIDRQPTVFLGLAGDLPLPLPQAIYRAFF